MSSAPWWAPPASGAPPCAAVSRSWPICVGRVRGSCWSRETGISSSTRRTSTRTATRQGRGIPSWQGNGASPPGPEARLAQTNFPSRRALPAADLEAAARRHFAAGVDVVLWGHFHRPWSLVVGFKQAHVVPGWVGGGTVVGIGDDGALPSDPENRGQVVD